MFPNTNTTNTAGQTEKKAKTKGVTFDLVQVTETTGEVKKSYTNLGTVFVKQGEGKPDQQLALFRRRYACCSALDHGPCRPPRAVPRTRGGSRGATPRRLAIAPFAQLELGVAWARFENLQLIPNGRNFGLELPSQSLLALDGRAVIGVEWRLGRKWRNARVGRARPWLLE